MVELQEAPVPASMTIHEEHPIQLGRLKVNVPAGRWRQMGSIPQGAVFKSADSVLIIGGSNAHEAYLVVSGGAIVGVYLPFEMRFIEAKALIPVAHEVP